MRNVWTIARRELRSYFDSPIAYIVLVPFLMATGWMFFSSFFVLGRADMRLFFNPFSPTMFVSPPMLLVILVPAVTMRLVAEERKTGTIELLTTMPIRDAQIVAGKFLGAWLLIATALATTFVYPIAVSFVGDLDWGPVVGGYVGLFLYASALLAIGTLCSTLTDNQIVAFIIGFVVCGALYFMYMLQFFFPGALGRAITFISVSAHLEQLARGVIDSRNVLYYLSVTLGALYLSVRSLERQHA